MPSYYIRDLRHNEVLGAQDVALDEGEVSGVAKAVLEQNNQVTVDLDANDATGASDEQIGESARPRADLKYQVIRRQFRRVDQTAHQVPVDEEVLPEALAGTQTGGGQGGLDLALSLDMFAHPSSFWFLVSSV